TPRGQRLRHLGRAGAQHSARDADRPYAQRRQSSLGCIDQEIRNSEGTHGLGPGLDVRGDGGCIVVLSPGPAIGGTPTGTSGTCRACSHRRWRRTRERSLLPDTFDTARLQMRPIAVEDADVIFDTYAQDTEVARYVMSRPHNNVRETHAYIEHCI